jgi:hypothetical protein
MESIRPAYSRPVVSPTFQRLLAEAIEAQEHLVGYFEDDLPLLTSHAKVRLLHLLDSRTRR